MCWHYTGLPGRDSGSEWTGVIQENIGLCGFEERAGGKTVIVSVLSPSPNCPQTPSFLGEHATPCQVSLEGCTSPTLTTPCALSGQAHILQRCLPAAISLGQLCKLFGEGLKKVHSPPITHMLPMVTPYHHSFAEPFLHTTKS